MHGDFSRWTHNAALRYRRVLQQQGRILLDADWNALNAMLLDEIQWFASDIIGAHGGPIHNCGFRVVIDPSKLAAGDPDRDRLIAFASGLPAAGPARKDEFFVTGGHYWVDGLLCDMTSDTTYRRQPDWIPYPDGADPNQIDVTTGGFLVYLKVWERHITDLDAPLIREAALLGPDTCHRTKLVWQVQVEPRSDLSAIFSAGDVQKAATTFADTWLAEHAYPSRPLRAPLVPSPKFPRPGLLRAWVADGPASDDPCILPADARYRGRENQLYRIEIHKGGTAAPADIGNVTFKIARDNGSMTFPIASLNGTAVIVEQLGRDARSGLSAGDTVEILDDALVLHGEPGVLARVLKVDTDENMVHLEYASGSAVPVYDDQTTTRPFLRRWDYKADLASNGGALSLKSAISDAGFPVDAGILAQFVQIDGDPPMRYQTGDYWLIPARTATGNIEWPRELIAGKMQPVALPAQGIMRHYAPIALVLNGDILNLRRVFDELAKDMPAGP